MTRKRILLKTHVDRKSKASLVQLQRAFAPWLNLDCLDMTKRERLFTWPRVFWLFLSQVLSADGSCREAVQRFLAWLALEEGGQASPNTSAYCKSRVRLPMEKIERICHETAEAIQRAHGDQGQWHGRPVKVVDGSGLSMPDTPENQMAFPQSKRATAGCGFPEMRIVALFSLATGVLLCCRRSSRYVSERALFRQLWDNFIPGDIVLADRGFCGYLEFFLLRQRGVDSVMRLHQRRGPGVRVIKKLGPGDMLVQWIKMKPCPVGFTKEQWAGVPAMLEVRHITFTVDIPGFRSTPITVATTLTDHMNVTASDFAQLYRRRWQAELYFRDIKISMGMDILRCLTPKMIEKEVMMYIIAHNLIRVTMIEAAQGTGQMVQRISFKGTCQALREWTPILAIVKNEDANVVFRAMLLAIGRAPLPHRPDRTEPRAKKRRPKNYQLMNKPRRLFKEIPHRSKYVKPT